MKAILLSLFCTILTAAPGKAQSTLLAEYKLTGGSKAAENSAPGVLASALTPANTGIVNTTASANNLYYLLKTSTQELPQTAADALQSNAYVSFTLTSQQEEIALGALTFDFGNHGTAFTLHAYAFAVITIDGTAYTRTATIYDPATDTTGPFFQGVTGASATATTGRATIDLSGLTLSSEATFQLYTYYDSLHRPTGTDPLPAGTAYSLRVDNLQIHAIPEPATAMILFFGLATFLPLRRIAISRF